VAVSAPSPAWWGLRPRPVRPLSIVDLIRGGTIDAELAALVWLLLDARLPVIAAAERSGTGKSTLLAALLDFLPPRTRRIELGGAIETFDWLPHARELGWRGPGQTGRDVLAGATPSTTYLLAAELSDHLPVYTWGDAARVALRALSVGYGLGATIHADSLEEVFATLRRPPVAVTDDELSRLGVVLVLRAVAPPAGDVASGPARRVVAAHYVRPIFRDVHGHIQRLAPAVLATWDPDRDRFEHFAWGIAAEIAARVGRRAGDFTAEHDRRRDYLTGLAQAGVTGSDAVRSAIDGYRAAATAQPS
jgi:flagellar protein FlaI